jgi:TatD DNase family protein
MPTLFDTHAHLDDEQFQEILPDVIERARQVGLESVVAVGTTAASSADVIALADRFDLVQAAVGIQPNYCSQAAVGDWEKIVQLSQDPHVVAIGETGLDRYWDYTPFSLQEDYFDRHLRLAQQSGLPFVVHMRDCEADILRMLREARTRGPLRGIMHSFTGSQETADACLELGMHVSFAGMVTYKKSEALRAIAASIPEDRLLLETDAPYLAPHPHRGRRPNEPALLVHTASCVAEVRGLTLDALAVQTTRNARRLFVRERP